MKQINQTMVPPSDTSSSFGGQGADADLEQGTSSTLS